LINTRLRDEAGGEPWFSSLQQMDIGLYPNAEQRDREGDGHRSACDPDFDGDGAIGTHESRLLRRAFGGPPRLLRP
jgi:hypothetical protein